MTKPPLPTSDVPEQALALLNHLTRNRGLLINRLSFYADAFGDMLFELSGPGARVCLMRDRSMWFIKLASVLYRPEDWYPIFLVFEHLTGRRNEAMSFEEGSRFVQENWPAIESAFSVDRAESTRLALERLGHERFQRVFAGDPRPKA